MTLAGRRLISLLLAATGLLLGLYLALRCQEPQSHWPQGQFLQASHIHKQLSDELELTTDQQAWLSEHLLTRQTELEKLQTEYKQIEAHFKEFETEVATYLSQKQIEQLRELGSRHREQERQRRKQVIENCLAATEAVQAATEPMPAHDLATQLPEIQATLKLDDATTAKLAKAMQGLFDDVETVRAQIKPRFRVLRTQIHGALSGELNNAQRQKLNDLDRRRACKP